MENKTEKNVTAEFLHSQIEAVVKERIEAANRKDWATANSHLTTLEYLLGALAKVNY